MDEGEPAEWETEYRAFQKRSLADRDYVGRASICGIGRSFESHALPQEKNQRMKYSNFNVARAYRELRGEPFDAPINSAEVFGTMFELRQWRGIA